MRLVLAFMATMQPALAWEFTPNPICTLTHAEADGTVTVTYDARSQDYAIAITRTAPWETAPIFGITFIGPRGLTISTTRQIIGDGGLTMTVMDKGFGNVLNGLEANVSALAFAGQDSFRFSLEGAAPEVQAFRACTSVGMA